MKLFINPSVLVGDGFVQGLLSEVEWCRLAF